MTTPGAEAPAAAPEGDAPIEGEPPPEGEVASPEAEVAETPEVTAEPVPAEVAPEPPAPTDAPDPWADRPDEPRVAGKPRTGKGLLIAGGVAAGLGIAGTIAFTILTRGCKLDGPTQCRFRDQDQLLIPVGLATFAIGAMLLAVGGGYYVQYKRWENWKPGQVEEPRRKRARSRRSAAVAPSWIPGGATIDYSVQF